VRGNWARVVLQDVLSRHDKAPERGAGLGRPKNLYRNSVVHWNPTRERLATPGSEFCVVVERADEA